MSSRPASTLVMHGSSDSESDSGSDLARERNAVGLMGLPLLSVVGSVAAVSLLCMLATSATVGPTPGIASRAAADGVVELATLRGTPAVQSIQQQLPQGAVQQQQNQPQSLQLQQQGGNQQLLPVNMQVTQAEVVPVAPEGGASTVSAIPILPQAPPAPLPRATVAPQAMAGALAVAPKEHLHDGNVCADDEEFHMGLCYEKCSTLTNGGYGVRQSAWTCCNQKVCNPITLLTGKCCRHHMGFCSGFDIAGLKEGNKVCPHKPGACLEDEELFLNLCFMKCSLLTQGQYPHRVGAATCCAKNDMSCLFDSKVKAGFVGVHGQADTNPIYNVGGGCGDGRNITKCSPHEPQSFLTESV